MTTKWEKIKPYNDNGYADALELEADRILYDAAKTDGVMLRDRGIHDYHRQMKVATREYSLEGQMARRKEYFDE